jgi:hypothetical protein
MTTIETAQEPKLAEDTRRLVDAVVRNLLSAQAAAGSRGAGADYAGGARAAEAAAPERERFFGSILQTLVQDVVPNVVPQVLGLLQQRRRELGLPEQRDAAVVERDLHSILGALLPKLIDAVPGIVNAIAGQAAPRSAEEEGERFLPFLAAVVPALVSAVPDIVAAFNRQRGVDATPPPISDPDVAQRFLGPLLSMVVPSLVQSAPAILGSIFGGRRELATSAW